MSVDVAYSRMLSETFSAAVALRFIYSDITYDYSDETSPGKAFAADIALYWNRYFTGRTREWNMGIGLNISNIGSKISYGGDDRVQRDYYDISPIAGIFKSFGDAPNGFKEEMQEIQWSMGLEYIYNDRFSLRAGYHHESENKGNRKYFTVGAGFRMSVFSLDAGYVFSTAQSNPLDQTMRFTLGFDLDGMKDLFGRRR